MKHFMYLAAAVAAMSLVLAAGAGASSDPNRPIDVVAATRGADLAPDDRVRHVPNATRSVRSADLAPDDRFIHRPGSEVRITPVVRRAGVGDSFDWVDAGIGAAAAFGLGLLLMGASALVLRRQRPTAFSQ
jgi:hypothetical protein